MLGFRAQAPQQQLAVVLRGFDPRRLQGREHGKAQGGQLGLGCGAGQDQNSRNEC